MQLFKTRFTASRATLTAVAAGFMLAIIPTSSMATQDATPETRSCADVLATPSAGMTTMPHGAMHGSTPEAHGAMHGMEMPEFDLMYIDMMIPHHESIIALAEVALPELTHPRLIEIAEAIIDTQSAENEAMRHLREAWYPGAETVSMDQMMGGMPGMGTDVEAMDQQMSTEWQVQAFCTAEDKDLAFIDQVIPHHQMAIHTSEDALELAVHPELAAMAEVVIAAQEQEIEELEAIRADLTGTATPTS